METTTLRNNFALRKVANRYPLRRHITAFFATLLVIAFVALGLFGAWQINSLMSLPKDQMELGIDRIKWMLITVSALLMLMSIFAVWELARRLSKPLRSLADEAQSIRDFDFSNSVAVNTGIEEVDELSIIMNEMKTTIRRFLEIGSSLTAERDLHSLLNRILREMVDVSRAVGGVIYLLEEDGSALRFETGRNAEGPDLRFHGRGLRHPRAARDPQQHHLRRGHAPENRRPPRPPPMRSSRWTGPSQPG